MRLTIEQIDAARTEKGGFTKDTLAGWGVPWPPPKRWKDALLAGAPIPPQPEPTEIEDYERLLTQVVAAVISSGNGHILNELPEVAAFYNCHIPTVSEIVGSLPKTAIIEGGITLQDRVYRFSCARQV